MSTLSGRVWTLYFFDTIPLSCLGPALQSTGVQDRVLAEAQGYGPLGSPGALWWILRSTPGKLFLTMFLKICSQQCWRQGSILLVGTLQSNTSVDLPLKVFETRQAGATVCLGPGLL